MYVSDLWLMTIEVQRHDRMSAISSYHLSAGYRKD